MQDAHTHNQILHSLRVSERIMTSQLCTEDSKEPSKFTDENYDSEKMSLRQLEQTSIDNVEMGTIPANVISPTPIITNDTKKCHFWKILNFILIIILGCVITVGFIYFHREIGILKQPKSVMLYRPTSDYLQNRERPKTVEWHLIDKHSQQHSFMQVNETHLSINQDGFFHISCSLLMETRHNQTNVITLLVFYSNKEQSINTKKSLPRGFNRFSLQLSIVLYLKKGAYFYVQVSPSKYLLKDPDLSYLSIAQQ